MKNIPKYLSTRLFHQKALTIADAFGIFMRTKNKKQTKSIINFSEKNIQFRQKKK